jgi:AcrR family transcriptional regulator
MRAMQRAYDMTRRAGRAEGTRLRIAAAALELFMEHDYDAVTLNAIARAAGVSHQTVLNHCESKSGVVVAAGEVFGEQVAALQAEVARGDVPSVVRAVSGRYEVLGDANIRWSALGQRIPEVADELVRGRASHQAWLEEVLGDLLPTEPRERRRVLHGLQAALDVHTWKLFRRDLGLSRRQTEQQLTDLVLGVLARHRS